MLPEYNIRWTVHSNRISLPISLNHYQPDFVCVMLFITDNINMIIFSLLYTGDNLVSPVKKICIIVLKTKKGHSLFSRL